MKDGRNLSSPAGKKSLSQEGLKLIACIAMLTDHVGIAICPRIFLRVVGRIAFPIFCFLLAEGIHYTKDPKKYGLRLFAAMLLSEIPFNLFHGSLYYPQKQSVMVTLFLGFLALSLMKVLCCPVLSLCAGALAAAAAQLLHTDYGAQGILILLMFGYVREHPQGLLPETVLLALLCAGFPCYPLKILGISVPIELFAVLAMIPISLYSGKKVTHSRTVQWVFYLFYPVHLLLLTFLR